MDGVTALRAGDASGKALQLTPLWEHALRHRRFPADVDAGAVFGELGARLGDPEWQVRQHAMRVLSDLVPVLDGGSVDELMAPAVLPALVRNLGHAAPAVRKAALDTLRAHLGHSADPEAVLRAVVAQGLERPAGGSSLQSNVAMGVVLGVPSLVQVLASPHSGASISREALVHLVGALSEKVVQVTFQEQALRSLVKIRDLVGDARFDRLLEDFHPQCKKDFDVLCQVYDVRSCLGDSGIDLQLPAGGLTQEGSVDTLDTGHGYWSEESSTPPFAQASSSDNSTGRDQNQNLVPSCDLKSSTDSSERTTYATKRLPDDDQNSLDDEGVSQEYDDAGNESDGEASSERESDEDEGPKVVLVKEHGGRLEHVTDDASELVIDEDVLQSGKIILETEIKFSEETAITMTILEEEDEDEDSTGRAAAPGSAGARHSDDDEEDEGIYNNDFVMKVLTDDDDDGRGEYDEEMSLPMRRTPRRVRFGGEMVVMRTPDSDAASGHPEEEEVVVVVTKEEASSDERRDHREKPGEVVEVKVEVAAKPRSSHIPLPVSPARNRPKAPLFARPPNSSAPADGPPTRAADSGECLTSSSSDGDYRVAAALDAGGSWEDAGIVSQQVLEDLYNKEDWCARARGLEQLKLQLHQADKLRRAAPRLASLLHALLVTLAEDRNHRVAAGALGVVRALQLSLPPHQLRAHLPQLVVGLARHIGGGGGGRVDVKIEAVQAAKVLMQVVRPGPVIDVLLTSSCVGAKSSKMRENSLLFLLYAAQTFPSTEFSWLAVAERVAQCAADGRRRVRQASLDALAVLSQFVAPRALERCLERAAERLDSRDQRLALAAAVKARLARRQLPHVSPDGLVLYALQIPAARGGSPSGPDVDWVLAGSGSVSPGSARSRGQLTVADPPHRKAPKTRPSPWSGRGAEQLSAVGVGCGRQQAAGSQVTWALVPVTTRPACAPEDDQRARGTLWSSDASVAGAQVLPSHQGSFHPVYLQFHNDSESSHHYASDRGFSLLPRRPDPPWGGASGAAGRDRLSQTWPPPEGARVLTPTQLRGRRVLRPLGDAAARSPDGLAPRRDRGSSGSRHKMPPLSSPSRRDRTGEAGPMEPARPPETSAEELRTARGADRQRARLPSRDLHQDEPGLRHRGTPPMLVEPAPTPDCTIPQKPVLVRQPVRQATPPEGVPRRAQSGSAPRRSPPFLPPVDGGRPAPIPLADELVFQSLESFDREEAASRRPASPQQQIFTKSMPQHRSSGALEEEKERNMKYQQLKQEERASATPCSPASAPPAISSTSGAAPDAAPDAAELVDLSPCTPPPPPEAPGAGTLGSSSPPVVELQLEVPGAAPPPPPPGAAAARPRRSVIPRQLKRNSVAPAPREPPRSRLAVKQSGGGGCLFPDTLGPADKPRDALQTYFHQLDSPEWEVAMQGLQTLVRLCRHHPDTVHAHLHAVLVALGRQVRNLRSQVSRAACQAAGELFLALRRAVEPDLDQLVVPLFHRAADTNKFLRADSNAALDRMVETISTGRAIAAICCKGATHQHALVRTTAARLLAGVVTRLGAERTLSLPRETRDKLLVTGANLLTEGSLDTRCHAKQMFRVLAAQHNLVLLMTEVVPPPLMRNIGKTLQALK